MIDLGINNLFIEAGNYGYTLKQRNMVKDQKTGEMKESFVTVGYHGTMESTLSAALNEVARARMAAYPENVALETAIGELKILHREFSDLLKKTVGKYEKVSGEENEQA